MRLLRSGTLATVLGVTCFAFATPAWASAGTQLSSKPVTPASADNKGGNGKGADNSDDGHNPPGNNGTVKIDSVPPDDSNRNEPQQLTCNFSVKFANFDQEQTATIHFLGNEQGGWNKELLTPAPNVTISPDAAAGAANDHDNVFTYSASQLNLSGLKLHKHGYHIKLSAVLASGAEKQKVFWLQPCTATSTGGGNNGGSGSDNGGGNNGGSGSNNGGGTTSGSGSTTPSSGAQPRPGASTAVKLASGSLPTTGTAVAGVVALGLVLVAAGGATLVVRRRSLKFRA